MCMRVSGGVLKFWIAWPGQASLGKWYLGKNVKEVKEQTTLKPRRGTFSHSNMCRGSTAGTCPVSPRTGKTSVAGTRDISGSRWRGQEWCEQTTQSLRVVMRVCFLQISHCRVSLVKGSSGCVLTPTAVSQGCFLRCPTTLMSISWGDEDLWWWTLANELVKISLNWIEV